MAYNMHVLIVISIMRSYQNLMRILSLILLNTCDHAMATDFHTQTCLLPIIWIEKLIVA